MKRLLLTFVTMLIVFSTLLHAEVPTKDSVTKLYVATFKRAPDAAGLDYWLNSSGLQLEGIASSFFDQPETQEKYPSGYTNTEFVVAVYDNLFNRAPEQAGLEYWVAELDAGRIEKSVFILAVINGAQNTIEYGNDATVLENKTIVGLAFSDAGFNDVTVATEIMIGITDLISTVTDALERYGIVVGNWSGSWLSSYTGLSGSVSVELLQNITAISGTMNIAGSPCIFTGTFSGTIVDNTVSFSVISGDTVMQFTSIYSDGTISGSYSVTSGFCAGDYGTFTLTRDVPTLILGDDIQYTTNSIRVGKTEIGDINWGWI